MPHSSFLRIRHFLSGHTTSSLSKFGRTTSTKVTSSTAFRVVDVADFTVIDRSEGNNLRFTLPSRDVPSPLACQRVVKQPFARRLPRDNLAEFCSCFSCLDLYPSARDPSHVTRFFYCCPSLRESRNRSGKTLLTNKREK